MCAAEPLLVDVDEPRMVLRLFMLHLVEHRADFG